MPDEYLNLDILPNELLTRQPFKQLKRCLSLQNIMFGRQVHGTDGLIVTNQIIDSVRPFSFDADFLITNQPGIGIGVMTGDCVPVVMFDSVNNVIAVVHAGWRGALAGIAQKALKAMHVVFKTHFDAVAVVLGPCARVCCYEVSEAFVDDLSTDDYIAQKCLIKRDTWYFDKIEYIRLTLLSHGVANDRIDLSRAICTIENDAYFSHRRQNKMAGRQMTVACLM